MGVGVGQRVRGADAALGALCALLLLAFSLIGCDDRHARSAPDPESVSTSQSASPMCLDGPGDVNTDGRVPHAGHFTALPGPARHEHDALGRAVPIPAAALPGPDDDTTSAVPRCHGPPTAASPARGGRQILVRLCIQRR